MPQHVLHRYHLVREIMNWGDVKHQKIDKKENLADPFTKALEIKKFDDFKWKMDIKYYPDWLFSPSGSCWKLYPKTKHVMIEFLFVYKLLIIK